MNRYVVNVDVKGKADEIELTILQNMVRQWAEDYCLEPTRVVIHPYVRKEKVFGKVVDPEGGLIKVNFHRSSNNSSTGSAKK